MMQTDHITSNDYHHLPASPRQIAFAQSIARSTGRPVPEAVRDDRRALSDWIERNRTSTSAAGGRFEAYPTSRQVAFAERIARTKRRDVPRECFRDRTLMSRWIDSNV